MKELTFFDQYTWEYLKQIKQSEDISDGTSGIMVPYMTDGELHEYCKVRSGEVKVYKLEVPK